MSNWPHRFAIVSEYQPGLSGPLLRGQPVTSLLHPTLLLDLAAGVILADDCRRLADLDEATVLLGVRSRVNLGRISSLPYPTLYPPG